MAILSKVGIASGSLIQAAQITQIIDALTASGSVIDILVTGSVNVEGPTRLGTLGENSQSPLIFNPDTSGESVFYVKNPSGALTIGTGENPYAGSDLVTLSPLGALSLNGNLTVGNNTIVNGNLGVGTTIPQAKFVVSNNNSQSIYMDYSAVLDANYIESFNTTTQTPLDMIYYMAAGATGSHRFYTNGSQKMVINRDGRVGIGTTTPTVPLNVNGETIITGSTTLFNNEGTLNLRGTNSTLVLLYPDNSTRRAYFGFSPSLTGTIILENEYLTGSRNIALVTNGGFVGINKYVPTVALDVDGGIEASTTITSPAMNTTHLTASNANISNAIIGNIIAGNITTNNTFTTDFSSSGTVTIGTPGVSSTSHIQLWPQDAAGNAYYINDSASIFNIGNGVFTSGFGTNMISVGGSFGVAIKKTFTNGSAALDVNGDTIITGSLTTTSNAVISGSLTTKSNAVISGSTIIRSTDNEVLKAIGGNSSVSAIVAQGGQPSFTLKDQSGVEKWTIFKPVATNNLSFWNGSAVVLSLQSGGNIGIGTNNTTPATKLDVRSSEANDVLFASNTNASFTNACLVTNTSRAAGTNCFFIYGVANSANTFQVFNNGNVVNANDSYGGISDIKLKENIVDTTPKLDKVMQVRVVNYNLKESLGYEPIKQLGVIAQELEEIFPGLVENIPDRDEKGKELKTSTKSVKMSIFVPILIKAVQEQQAQIEELKLQVATLISGSI
jgi:hypothetical protein